MLVYCGCRQNGKTTALIRKAAESSGYIVAATEDRARHVQNMARQMGVNIRNPITHAEFLQWSHGHFPVPVLVDDVECLLHLLAGPSPVLACAIFGEPIEPQGGRPDAT